MARKMIINLKKTHDFMMYFSQSRVLFYNGEYYKQTYSSGGGGGGGVGVGGGGDGDGDGGGDGEKC